MTSISNERIYANLYIPNVKNYNKWCKQMKVLFDYQDVLDVIKNSVNPLVKGVTLEQRASSHKEEKNKDFKTLILIHQCVDTNNFEKVGDCESLMQS